MTLNSSMFHNKTEAQADINYSAIKIKKIAL